jgi:hypothetical protein
VLAKNFLRLFNLDVTELNNRWPPEGHEAVGDYAFAPPNVPSLEQVEEAEMFIFSNAAFSRIDESQRRRNVIRLAVNSVSTEQTVGQEEGSQSTSTIPLIGNVTVLVTSVRHDGSVISHYEVQSIY